uniref:Uncharacterized protein n=1 Tax=Bubo bubo TaxID=30461 RepID=A0A8C0ID21_BUBBB
LSISKTNLQFLMTNKFYGGSARNWSTLDSVEIVQDGEKFAKFNVSVMSAPVEYSFHCQLVGTSNLYPARLIPSNNEGLHSMLNCTHLSTFFHFQIQGFNVENKRFSYASDCTGFFTPGIWMGLVISIVLLWILAYGIHMITQINSLFDRKLYLEAIGLSKGSLVRLNCVLSFFLLRKPFRNYRTNKV